MRKLNPAWEGKTESGIIKRIFAYIGRFFRLKDSNGFLLRDKNNNILLVRK